MFDIKKSNNAMMVFITEYFAYQCQNTKYGKSSRSVKQTMLHDIKYKIYLFNLLKFFTRLSKLSHGINIGIEKHHAFCFIWHANACQRERCTCRSHRPNTCSCANIGRYSEVALCEHFWQIIRTMLHKFIIFRRMSIFSLYYTHQRHYFFHAF